MCNYCIASNCDGIGYRTIEPVYEFIGLRELHIVMGCQNSVNVIFVDGKPCLYTLNRELQAVYHKMEIVDG
jgi:hypothetical protein